MKNHEIENWKKIKEVMEASGNTNNMFYKRAVEILKSGNDPLSRILGNEGKY
jgi:hypothetical protein